VTSGTPPTEPKAFDADEVLAALVAAIERTASAGLSVTETSSELDALRDEADTQTLSASPLLAEIDAVARRLRTLSEAHPIDRWEVTETVDQAAEVLRLMRTDTLRRRIDAQPQAALDFITKTLASLPERDIQRLLTASGDELTSWRREGVPDAKVERLRVVSQLLLELRDTMSPEDVMVWFSAQRAHLDGRTPLEMLRDRPDGYRERLRRLAQAPHSVQAA
jgi:hypothetical protein